MKIGKALLGGIIAALASSSLAIASCTSYCLQCEGYYGSEFTICFNKCLNQTDDCPPPGN
jgi:hypothetical protein